MPLPMTVMVRLAQKAFYPGSIPFPLLHIDTNGKVAQKSAWKARKRTLRRIASAERRQRESAELAGTFLRGMESPPLETGTPHWNLQLAGGAPPPTEPIQGAG